MNTKQNWSVWDAHPEKIIPKTSCDTKVPWLFVILLMRPHQLESSWKSCLSAVVRFCLCLLHCLTWDSVLNLVDNLEEFYCFMQKVGRATRRQENLGVRFFLWSACHCLEALAVLWPWSDWSSARFVFMSDTFLPFGLNTCHKILYLCLKAIHEQSKSKTAVFLPRIQNQSQTKTPAQEGCLQITWSHTKDQTTWLLPLWSKVFALLWKKDCEHFCHSGRTVIGLQAEASLETLRDFDKQANSGKCPLFSVKVSKSKNSSVSCFEFVLVSRLKFGSTSLNTWSEDFQHWVPEEFFTVNPDAGDRLSCEWNLVYIISEWEVTLWHLDLDQDTVQVWVWPQNRKVEPCCLYFDRTVFPE